MSTKRVVIFSDIFDEEPQDLGIYLQGISKATFLKATTFFLGFDNQKSIYDDYRKFIDMFFCSYNSGVALRVLDRLDSLKSENKSEIELEIVYNISCLYLFEFCFDKMTDSGTQSIAEAEINIFKALLVQNEIIINLENGLVESMKDLNTNPDQLKFAIFSLAQSFSYNELTNYNLNEVFTAQALKSILFFEFLESFSKTKALLSEFLKYFNCTSWKEYILKILPLGFAMIKHTREAQVGFFVEQGNDFQENCFFFDKLSITDIDAITDDDFKKIRATPFYKIGEGKYEAIFRLFVIEIMHKGLFFKLNEINKGLKEKTEIKDFRGIYCDEFSEKYLLYQTLESIYHNKYIKFSGARIKEQGIEAEPDYYIRNGSKIFLFESKDVLINATVKHSYDYMLIEKELQKKLYFDDDGKKIKKKAVLQLIDNIRRILTKQLPIDSDYNEKSVSIYPVIIVHDRQFNASGLNILVNSWFQKELQKISKDGLNTLKVRKITIIDIDTLLLFQDLFRDREIRLETLIDEYLNYTELNIKKKYKNHDRVMEVFEPFSVFAYNHVINRRLNRSVPKIIETKGISLFAQ